MTDGARRQRQDAAPSTLPPYISNDSSLGGDEFYDAVDDLDKRISRGSRGSNIATPAFGSSRSSVAYGSNRSTGSAGLGPPTAEAAELMAHLASGSGRRANGEEEIFATATAAGGEGDMGWGNSVAGSTVFGSTTANEGPPGGSLGLDVFLTARFDEDGPAGDATAVDQGKEAAGVIGTAADSSGRSIRRWPPSAHQQPQNVIVLDISSTETSPNTTPGGSRGKSSRRNSNDSAVTGATHGSSGALGGASSSPSPQQPLPQPPARQHVSPAPSSTNPFAPPVNTGSPINPFAPGCDATACAAATTSKSTRRSSNPFVTSEDVLPKAAASSAALVEPRLGGVVAASRSPRNAASAPASASTAVAKPADESSSTASVGPSRGKAPPLPPRPVNLLQNKGAGNASPVSVSSPARSTTTVESNSTDVAANGLDGADAGSVGSSAASVDTAGGAPGAGVESGGGREGEGASGKFKIVNKDTGQVFDIREVEQHVPSETFGTLLPSRADLMTLERQRSASGSGNDGSTSLTNTSSSVGTTPLSPSSRHSISSVAASMAAAVGTSSTRKEKARSLGIKVRKGLGKVATASRAAAAAAASGSSGGGGGGDGGSGGDKVDSKATAGGGGNGGVEQRSAGGGGIGAAARNARMALSGIRVSFKGKETPENLADLMLLQELKAHEGPIWAAAFNHSGKILATAGADMSIVLHHVGDVFAMNAADTGDSTTPSNKSDTNGKPCDSTTASPRPTTGVAAAEDVTPGVDNAMRDPQAKPPATGKPATTGRKPGSRSGSDPAVSAVGATSCGEERGENSVGGGVDSTSTSGSVPPGGAGAKAGGSRREGARRPSVPLCVGLVPCQVFRAHKGDVVALSWSRNDFLLSASLDKTVRLWHTTQPVCLSFFRHNDIVTAVDFHPLMEHFFLSGCFDKKIRVWNIRDGHVQLWQQAPDMVTAAKFSLDGTMIVAGLYMGQVLFYQTEGMRYFTQIECRNRRGAMKRGRKVTGFAFMSTAVNTAAAAAAAKSANGRSSTSPSTSPGGRRTSAAVTRGSTDGAATAVPAAGTGGAGAGGGGGKSGHVPEQLLVTTNDSRVRLYNTDDFVMNAKYKGLSNDTLQITASFSEDGKQIISGSENGKVYVWGTGVVTKPPAPDGLGAPDIAPRSQSRPGSPVSTTQKDTNRSHESFEASSSGGQGGPKIVTYASFVPESTVRCFVTAVRGCLNKDVVESGGYCSSMILATDYEGCLRVYCKSSILLS